MTKETLKRSVIDERYEEIMKDIKFHYKQGFDSLKLKTRFSKEIKEHLIKDGFEIKDVKPIYDKIDDSLKRNYEEFVIVLD